MKLIVLKVVPSTTVAGVMTITFGDVVELPIVGKVIRQRLHINCQPAAAPAIDTEVDIPMEHFEVKERQHADVELKAKGIVEKYTSLWLVPKGGLKVA